MDVTLPPTTQTGAVPDPAQPVDERKLSVGRLERWTRQNPIDAIAVGLILVHLAIRSAWVADAWFAEDDFTWIAGTYGKPFSWEMLAQNDADRPLVGCWALSWLITKVAPFEHWPAAVLLVAMHALAAVLFWRVVRRLFGPTPGMLIPLTLYLFWAMTTSTSVWWSVGVLRLPAQIAFAAVFLLQLRYLEKRRIGDALGSTAVMAVGVLFFEKTLLVTVLLFWFTAFYAVRGSVVRRVVGAVRTAWPIWVGHIAVAAAYTAFYLTRANQPSQAELTWSQIANLAENMVVRAFGTMVWGGPWRWTDGTPAQESFVAPPDVAVWLAGALSLGLILLSLLAGVRSIGAWVMLAGYLAATVVMITAARLSFGPEIGLADRYLSDVAPVAALAVGLAFLPLRGSGAPPEALPAAPPVGPFRVLRSSPALASIAVTTVVTAVAISSLVSASQLASRWSDLASKEYFANLRSGLQAQPGRENMFDESVPEAVVNPLVAPSNKLEVLMRAVPEHPRFPTWTHSFVVPDRNGRLHPGTVTGNASRKPPNQGCGWLVQGGKSSEIPLAKDSFRWPWLIKVAYFTNASGGTPADITFGGHTEHVQLRRGLNDLFVRITGEGDSVRIGGLDPGASICVAEVVVGEPEPRIS